MPIKMVVMERQSLTTIRHKYSDSTEKKERDKQLLKRYVHSR